MNILSARLCEIFRQTFQRFSDMVPAKSRQNESPGNRIASNFNRIRPTRSVSVNKCSISCSLNVRFLVAKRTKRRTFHCETLIKWVHFNGKLPITSIAMSIWRYADSPLFWNEDLSNLTISILILQLIWENNCNIFPLLILLKYLNALVDNFKWPKEDVKRIKFHVFRSVCIFSDPILLWFLILSAIFCRFTYVFL